MSIYIYIFTSLLLQIFAQSHCKANVPEVQHCIIRIDYTGLFQMIVGVLTTCHTQYT